MTQWNRVTVLQVVLPALEAECRALDRACRALGSAGEDVGLGRLLEKYDSLNPGDPLQRELIGHVKVDQPDAQGHLSADRVYTPYLCRLFRSGISVEDFTEHFEAVRQIGAGDSMPVISFTHDSRASELCAVLADPGLVNAWNKTLASLSTPVPGLSSFFENLFVTYGARRSRFGIVLLLDQFEELFTRFVDTGPIGSAARLIQPNWRLRWEILEEIKAVYSMQTMAPFPGGEEVSRTSVYLPLRFVVSMRDEYVAQFVAQFDPLREVIPDLDIKAYHLALLTIAQAEAAIKEPASHFHYRYSPELYSAMIAQLTKEERYVEPAHLQIVCEKLWAEGAQTLSARETPIMGGAAGEAILELGVGALTQMKGVQGILKAFFQEFLHGPEIDAGARLEILELLETLVTPARTRNILEKQELVRARFRDPVKREDLLSRLVNRTIVRVEPRLGGNFVEITHEFLIEPILEAIATELTGDLEYTRFRTALRRLETLVPANAQSLFGGLLSRQDFEALNAHAERLCWDHLGIELMLRSAIVVGANRTILEPWLERFSASEWDDERLFSGHISRSERETLMNLEQLRILNESREPSPEADIDWLEWVLRSELNLATDFERVDVAYWTRRLENADAQGA